MDPDGLGEIGVGVDAEELRRAIVIYPVEPERRPRRGRAIPWQVPVLVVLTALVVWPVTVLDSGEKVAVAAEVLERGSTEPPDATTTTVAADITTATTITTIAAEPSTSTTATTVAWVSPPTTTAPPTTTTTTMATKSTTPTTGPTATQAIQRQSTSGVFAGLHLTLTASAPWSGAVRTAGFQLTAEFRDTRVLRSVRIDFGDRSAADANVRAWDCWDSAAPNPYNVTGPIHTYAAPGTYQVVATVRTGLCSPGEDAPAGEPTAQLPLTLVVP